LKRSRKELTKVWEKEAGTGEMSDTTFEKFTRDYRKTKVIFEENNSGNEMYIVHSGKVRLFASGEAGELW